MLRHDPHRAVTPLLTRRAAPDTAVWLSGCGPGRLRIAARHAAAVARTGAFDLVVDLARHRVELHAQDVAMEGRELPLRLLATLARARGAPVSRGDLYGAVWDVPFARHRDTDKLHVQVNTVRRLLRSAAGARPVVERVRGGYRLAAGLRALVFEPAPVRLRPRALFATLLAVARDRGFLDRRTVCQLAGVADTSAHTILARLVAHGGLVRDGAGRGTRYRPSTTIASSARAASAVSADSARSSSAASRACSSLSAAIPASSSATRAARYPGA